MRELLKWAEDYALENGKEDSAVKLLLMHVTGKESYEILADMNMQVPAEQVEAFEAAVKTYIEQNIPILVADTERRVCKDSNKPWNFLIEGDNLQALLLLEKTHKGMIDCIYIDPPYNTGAKDWKYNNDYVGTIDNYRHSKWL